MRQVGPFLPHNSLVLIAERCITLFGKELPMVSSCVKLYKKKQDEENITGKKWCLKASDKNTARLLQHGFFVQSLSSFCLLRLQVGRNIVRNTAADHQSV